MVKPRALVTGATGGLGRTLVPLLLDAGYEVAATGRDPAVGATLSRMGAKFCAADLRVGDPAALIGNAEVVFHLAALSSPWGRRADFAAINITATARLLEAARMSGCRRFVHASTPSIFTENRNRLQLAGDSPVARRFANSYAATKFSAERLVLAADSPTMRTVVLRPRAIVGPNDKVLLPRLLRVARQATIALPRGGAALAELTDVRDVAAAFLAADRSIAAAGRAINISGGQPRTVRALVDHICAVLGLAPRIVAVPMPIAMGTAWLTELAGTLRGREPKFTRYMIKTLGFSQTFDPGPAHALLDWRPRFSPEDAIAHALADRSGFCAR